MPKSGKKGEIFVTVALTELNARTGWFVFLEGSHKSPPKFASKSEWRKMNLDLSIGDALVWQGDLAYLHSAGGGGKFMTLVYDTSG